MKFSLVTGQAGSTLVLFAYALSLSAAPSFAQSAPQKQTEEGTALDPIVVIATQNDKDTIAQSEVTSDFIDRTLSATVPGLLSGMPGIELVGNSRVAGQSININGFGDSEDIDITLDGASKKFERYQQGSVFIDPDMLKKIDVTKGSFAASKYGAFGGSLEMVTKSASDMLRDGETYGAFLKQGYASNGHELTTSAATYGRSEAHGAELIIGGTYRNNQDFLVAANEETLNLSAGDMVTGYFKGSLERENHFFEVSGNLGYSNNYQPWSARAGVRTIDQEEVDKHYGGDKDNFIRTQAANREIRDTTFSGRYEYKPDSDLIDLTIKANYAKTAQHDTREEPTVHRNSHLRPDYQFAPSSTGNWTTLDYTTYKLEIENTSVFDMGELEAKFKYGLQLSHNIRDSLTYSRYYRNDASRNYGLLQPYKVPGGTQTIYSAWGEYTLDFGKLEVTPGLRYDFIRTKGEPNLAPRYNKADRHDYGIEDRSGLSPSLSAVYAVTPGIRLFADLAYKLRAPLIDEYYDTEVYKSTSNQLTNERIFAKRIGVAGRFSDVLREGDTVAARVSYYHNQVYDNIYRLLYPNNKNWPSPRPVYVNNSGYHTQGVDAEIYYDSENWFGGAVFSFMEGKHNGLLKDPTSLEDSYVAEIAPTKLVLNLGYKMPEHDLTIGWRGRFLAKQKRTSSDINLFSPSSGYAVHDLFMTWAPEEGRFAGIEARASLENIFNKRYRPYFADAAAHAKGVNFKTSIAYKF